MAPTDDELRTAVQAVLWNASNYPAKVQAHMLGQDISQLTAKVADAILPLVQHEAVAAERERIISEEEVAAAAFAIYGGTAIGWSNLAPGEAKEYRRQARCALEEAAAAIRGDREPEPATEEGSNRG